MRYLLPILVLVPLLAAISWLPAKLSRREFVFSLPPSETAKSLPSDHSFVVLRGPSNYPIGTKITLGQLATETRLPLMVNFWATWCPPCVEEFPSLLALHQQLLRSQQKKVGRAALVTISVDSAKIDVDRFFASRPDHGGLIVLHDPDGELARGVGTVKFPETYLIEKSGKILYKWVGPQNWLSDEILRKISAVPH